MKRYDAIGVIEAQYYPIAVSLLDQALKTSNITFLASENYLGGKLVTLIIGGSIADVSAAIETVKETEKSASLKKALVITNPHPEIMKFIIKKPKQIIKKQAAKKKQPEGDK